MKTLIFSRFFVYLGWFLSGFFLLILVKLKLLDNPILFSLGFFYLLLLPGFCLSRLFKFENLSFVGQFLVYFVLGLGFYFLITFLAILTGISLQLLSFILIFLLIVLFAANFILDFFEKNFEIKKLKYKFDASFIFWLLPLMVSLFVLWMVYLRGPNLNGDPYFHLAIIKKALEGSSLSYRSLSFTKTLMINPTYAFPAWHIFLAFLARIFFLDIFIVWRNILFPLTIISIFSWGFLAKVIFQKKILVVLALLLWLILTFYDGPGYLFTRLGVPDTFSQLILLPLGLAFTFKYVFTKNLPRKFLIVNFLIAVILLVTHGPHYFYLLISIFGFSLFCAIFYLKATDYRLTLFRLLEVFLAEILVLVVLGIAMELRAGTLSAAVSAFNKSSAATITYTSFSKFPLVYKYSFFLLPLILVISRPRWRLIGVNLLLVLLIYFTALKDFFTKLLSIVFTDRLLSNLGWYFFVFAITLGIFLYLVDLFISHRSKNIKITINIFISLVFLVSLVLEIKYQTISDFIYKILYDKSTNAYVSANYLWFFAVAILLAIILLIVKFVLKKDQLVKIDEEPKNHFTMFLLISFIAFALLLPSIINFRIFLGQPRALSGQDYFLVALRNNSAVLNYLETQIPPKSVVLTSGAASKGLSVLSNQYMAYDVGSAYEKNFAWVFDSHNPDTGKAEIVTAPKWAIAYIYLENPILENSHFKAHPEIYQLVYQDQSAEVYKIIK